MTKPRMTVQRRKIFSAIANMDSHVTAEIIYGFLHKEMPELSLSTVYRNLKALSSQGLVSASDLDGKLVFEAVGQTPHHHLVCMGCHSIVELDHKMVETLFHQIEKNGFKVTTSHLVLYGFCQRCQSVSND
jgi:Fe2+ or Zn2+ uptake regulation protein